MKRLVALLLSAVLLLPLFGCAEQSAETESLKIVCTVFPQYDFVRNIAGDKAEISMLVPLGTESHDFQLENLTVAELKSVATADLVIYIGGESDSDWIEKLKATVNGNGIKWLALTDTVEALEELNTESMKDIHDHEHHHEEHGDAYDEHVWTSPKSAVKIVAAITEELCGIDAENAELYRKNSELYTEKLNGLDKSLTESVANGSGKTLIFGDRFPFRYLCADYGLDYDAAFPGCSANSDPSVAQIASLTKNALKANTKTVFYMENSKSVFAESIAEKIGGKAELLHSCHTFSKKELENGADYVSVMQENIRKITEALK